MKIYGNRYMIIKDIAEIDLDIVAFNVSEEDVEEVVEYLASAIITKNIMASGEISSMFE